MEQALACGTPSKAEGMVETLDTIYYKKQGIIRYLVLFSALSFRPNLSRREVSGETFITHNRDFSKFA